MWLLPTNACRTLVGALHDDTTLAGNGNEDMENVRRNDYWMDEYKRRMPETAGVAE